MTEPQVFRVALDMPLRRVFDYLAPQGAAEPVEPELVAGSLIEPGMRVRVPFGRQRLVGVVMEVAASSDLPAERLKPILQGSLAFTRKIDEAAACMHALQAEVLSAQSIPVQGRGREAYRS